MAPSPAGHAAGSSEVDRAAYLAQWEMGALEWVSFEALLNDKPGSSPDMRCNSFAKLALPHPAVRSRLQRIFDESLHRLVDALPGQAQQLIDTAREELPKIRVRWWCCCC